MVSLAHRCLDAGVEVVTEVMRMVVSANTTSIMDGPPPQEPSSSIPSWM